MLCVDERNDPAALADLRPTWQALLAQTPQASFLQSCEWLETYWRHYGGAQRLRVLTVRKGGEIVGIVPLSVLREPTRLGAMRLLTYPQAYWGSFYGPIGPEPRATLRAALQHVGRTRRDWDLLDLRFAPPNELDPAATEQVMHECGFTTDSRQTDSASLIDLPPTYDEYLATRTSKWRMNVRRWTRRLAERGDVRFVRYRALGGGRDDNGLLQQLYADCEHVARHSWQGSATDGTTITHDSVRPFLQDMHATASAAGAADMSLLYLNDRPIAFLYCYAYRGYVCGLRVGFDEAASRDGVGNLLYMQVIEDSIRRGDRTLDLGQGYLDAKKPLVTRVVPIYRRTYGNPFSVRGLLWRAKRSAPQFISRYNSSSPPTATTIETSHADV